MKYCCLVLLLVTTRCEIDIYVSRHLYLSCHIVYPLIKLDFQMDVDSIEKKIPFFPKRKQKG